MERSLRRRYNMFTLNAYWLGVSFMWNSLHPIVLPVLLLEFAEETKNTAYGMLTFLGLLIALVVQPLSGALSDHTRHRWGRRRPWILLGTLLDVVLLLAMVTAKSFWALAAGYVLLQFSSNLAHGPAQGLIPDLVPEEKRGVASGVKGLFEMTGIICAALVAGRIVGGAIPRYLLVVLIIVGVLLLSMTVTLLGVHEPSSLLPRKVARHSLWGYFREVFAVDLRGQRDYARLLISRFLVLLGVYAVQSFALYYFRDALQFASPARMMGDLMIAIGASVTLTVYPAGLLSERWGRKGLSLFACAVAGVGMGALAFTRSTTGLWVLGSLIGLSMGIFASVNWAWATDLVPVAEAGKYLGLSNLATAGAAAAARLFGPFMI
ncbi:MAG: MFS transporter [Anaerolineae bacterium]|nr:MFS transporter [Anaerolineae bacterium]